MIWNSLSIAEDLDPLPLEVGAVPSHDGGAQLGGHAGDQRVPQAELSPGPMSLQTRCGGPAGRLRRGGDVLERSQQARDRPEVLIGSPGEGFAGDDVAGEQVAPSAKRCASSAMAGSKPFA